jgi:hypothetical protein
MNYGPFQQLRQLHSVRELYESTNYRRFLQLVAYAEKEMGLPWPQLLDQLSGGGAALALRFDKKPLTTDTIIQGKDAATLQKFLKLACTVVEGELARQESKERLEKSNHRGIETLHIGTEFHAAALGSALAITNQRERIHELIDGHLDQKKNLASVASIRDARKKLPADSLAWMWLNLEAVRQLPQVKDIFAHPRNDPNMTVVFGGWLDVARRAPFLCAALYPDNDQVALTVRIPAGRDGMPPELAVHIPPSAKEGSLPLLEPRGVFLSTSYYLDVGKFWDCRHKLFNEQIAKAFEDADKRVAPFLAGNKLSTLLTQAGPHQRFVLAYQPDSGYPKGRFGFVGQLGYAFVVDMRDPAFGQALETILRGAGLLARTFGQVNLKLQEEKFQGVTIVSYRQDDSDRKARLIVGNDPFADLNSPSFAAVGDQFIAASTIELTKELIAQLQKAPPATRPDSPASQTRLYSIGSAKLLDGIQDILLAQTILDQALPPAEAREEVRRGIDWVRNLGDIDIHTRYTETDFHYDIVLAPHKGHKETTKK